MDIIMVTFASPAARRVAGNEKATGHTIIQLMLWKYNICFVVSAVRSDKWYAFNINGSRRKMTAFIIQISTYLSLIHICQR